MEGSTRLRLPSKWAIVPGLLILSVIANLNILAPAPFNKSHRSTKSTDSPSYMRLCNAVLVEKAVNVVEDPEVCADSNAHNALLHIFASSFIASLVDSRLDITYQHDCHSRSPMETIQKYLPSPIRMPEISQFVSVEELCQRCTTPECILFSHEEESEINRKIINAEIASSINHATMAYAFMHRGDVSEVDDSTAVIYLAGSSCPDYVKDMHHFIDYPLAIPDTVSRIKIIATDEFRAACLKDCDKETEKHCEYDLALRKFLKDYFRTKTPMIEGPNTVAQFLEVKLSRYLICPVGDQCLFPALSSRHFVRLLGGGGDIASWFKDSINVSIFPSSFSKGSCSKLQGRHGKWIQDMENAESYQYDSQLIHYFGSVQMNHEASDEFPYHPSSTYKWNEPYFPNCQFKFLTKADVCYTLSTLGIERVLFVGDGLQYNMAQSFWKLIGQKDPIDNNFSGTFSCATLAHPLFEIEMQYIRNDQLIENDLPVDMTTEEPADRKRNCNGFCYPWTEIYQSSPKNTLLVLNTGAHYSLLKDFEDTVKNVFRKLDSLGRQNDIVFFRTVAPRHEKCETQDKPYESYHEYLDANPSDQIYNRYVSKFNGYVAHLLENRQAYLSSSYPTYFAEIQLLDIFPMTVVRPDAHIVKKTQSDCFHYSLPGVLDWWNHLLYNHLNSLVIEKSKEFGS